MSIVAVNLSGVTLPVYADFDYNTYTGYNKIGDIYHREAFGEEGAITGTNYLTVIFRDPYGVVRNGFLDTMGYGAGAVGAGFYPYGTAVINGVEYKTYYMRRSETIYNPDASVWGTAGTDALVATTDGSQSGTTHADWLMIEYVQHMPDRTWVPINNSAGYGFVNIGLEDGSMPDTISLYGSW
jgi:hypothetical protein